MPWIVEKREMGTELTLGDESVPVTKYDTDFGLQDRTPNMTAKSKSAFDNINLLGAKVKPLDSDRNKLVG